MIKFALSLLLISSLLGCIGNNPGEQCLDSFKLELKDPDSGKVISFQGNELTYSATNSYGARIQSRALCNKFGGNKWARDKTEEYFLTSNLSIRKFEKFNACRAEGKKGVECFGSDSLVIKNAALSSSAVDSEALNRESARELGFNY